MGLIGHLRTTAGRVLRRWRATGGAAEPTFRPDLSEAGFFGSLRTDLPLLAEARQRFDAGDAGGAGRAVLAHFEQRAAPVFFVAPRELPALAERLRRLRPDWVAALGARVDDERLNGLRLMDRRHAPPGPGFAWQAIPPGPHGDTLYSAQPHRFGFLPQLVLAAHYGRATLEPVEALLDGWIDAARAGEPECYHSPLAVLYRVLALSWAWVFAAALPGDDRPRTRVLLAMLRILGEDMRYLLPTIGHSYPNNHLLADGFAGWYLGTLYPEFSLAPACRSQGEPLFVSELLRQFLPDGSNFEHSTHYHELGCEMAAAYVLLARRNGVEPAAEVVQRLRAMLHFQAAVGGPEAQPFVMGDSTDDPLFPLDTGHSWANAAMRELYRGLFDAGLAPAPVACSDAERAYWLLGGSLAPASDAATPLLPALHFDRGGVHVLQDQALRARLILRTGPVEGSAISAGHAHADLMSVHLNVAGRRLVVGAGTCSYRLPRRPASAGATDWRSYFAGPDAHNGLVEVPDPLGAMEGDFRNRDVDCRVRLRHCLQGPGLTALEAEVTRGPQRGHRRGVVHVHGCYWLVYDLLPERMHGARAAVGLQFDADVVLQVRPGGRQVHAAATDADCLLTFGSGLDAPRVLSGSHEPPGGWIAPRYGHLAAAPQLRARVVAAGVAAFVVQAGEPEDAPARVEARREGGRLCFEWVCANRVDRLDLVEEPRPALSWGRRQDGVTVDERRVRAAD
jgi:hypothetical protein